MAYASVCERVRDRQVLLRRPVRRLIVQNSNIVETRAIAVELSFTVGVVKVKGLNTTQVGVRHTPPGLESKKRDFSWWVL